MIPLDIAELLNSKGYTQRLDKSQSVLMSMSVLGIPTVSEIAEFYSYYDSSIMLSDVSYESLQDVVSPSIDGETSFWDDPWDTPLGMTTKFVRDVWQIPNDLICLTSTEGEGAYLYSLRTGGVYDFTLGDQNGLFSPRWDRFYNF